MLPLSRLQEECRRSAVIRFYSSNQVDSAWDNDRLICELTYPDPLTMDNTKKDLLIVKINDSVCVMFEKTHSFITLHIVLARIQEFRLLQEIWMLTGMYRSLGRGDRGRIYHQ